VLAALVAAAGLLWVYWGSLLGYLRDQHYQEHFVYLWCFVALALWRSLARPFRSRFAGNTTRDRFGLLLIVAATALLALAEAAGSSTGARTSLVMVLTGLSVLVVSGWSIKRCLMHGALLQLCFGVPYSFYFPLTAKLRWGVASIIGLPEKLGLASYHVQANVVHFPHYDLVITSDCSGIGQLLTFAGIAALGILSSAQNRRRTIGIMVLAVVLAWLSNVARVSMFVLLVGLGWTESVDNPTWHSLLGFLVFLPFVITLVAVIVRTYRPPRPSIGEQSAPGRWHVNWLVVPLVVVHGLVARDIVPRQELSYYADLSKPPQHRLHMHSPSQDNDREAYQTPWLLGARFVRSDYEWFDLLHYSTRSRSHMCVHKVADCLSRPGQAANYAEPVEVDGRLWWRIALDMEDGSLSWHAYFAFEVGGERHDDSFATQLLVMYQRLFRGDWDVRLTRVVLPGKLPAEPTAYEAEVLTWLGRTIDAGS